MSRSSGELRASMHALQLPNTAPLAARAVVIVARL